MAPSPSQAASQNASLLPPLEAGREGGGASGSRDEEEKQEESVIGMAISGLIRSFGSLLLSSCPRISQIPVSPNGIGLANKCHTYREISTSAVVFAVRDAFWKCRTKYTIKPIPKKKTAGRDHTGRITIRGLGGGRRQCYRMIDFRRLNFPDGIQSDFFEEKVLDVRYDPCRSAHIALVAGAKRKRWIIATENMQPGDIIKNSSKIERMSVLAKDGDAYPLGALPIGTLVNNVESHPGKGAQYIRAAGTCGVLIRKVNGTAIVQLPSKRQMQVLETCVATVGRVSNVEHDQRNLGKAGRNRWLGHRPRSGLWHRKGGWAGRKIKPLPRMKSYVNLPPPSSCP